MSVSWHDAAYPIDLRWRQLERLWVSGSLFDGPATDAQILAELRGIIKDLKAVEEQIEIAPIKPTGDWLD